MASAIDSDDDDISGLAPVEKTRVTLPEEGDVPAPEDDVYIGELAGLAEAQGISVDEARSMIETQSRLQNFAQEAMSEPGVLDFRFTPDGRRGELLVEQGLAVPELLPELVKHPEIEVIESALTPKQRTDAVTAIQKAIDPISPSLVPEPYFDGFDGEFVVLVDDGAEGRADLAADLTGGVREATGSPSVYVTIPEPNDEEAARGGKRAVGQYNCTSGFGILIRNQYGGYLTAGHCGQTTTNFTINGYSGGTNVGRRIGGSHDRIADSLAGAHYWVQIHENGTEADMTSTPGQVVLYGYYCHYGQTSNDQDCGTIYDDNLTYTTWATGPGVTSTTIRVWKTNAFCQSGDSGGPVWTPTNPRQPRALINSSSGGAGNCGYQPLNLQMDPSTWTLL